MSNEKAELYSSKSFRGNRVTVPLMGTAHNNGLDEDRLRERIRSRLDELGMSYAQLARITNKSEDAIKKMMTTHGLKQYVKLIELCRALDTTPNDLLGFSSIEPDATALLAAIQVGLEAVGQPPNDAAALAEIIVTAANTASESHEEVPQDSAARLLVRAAVSRFRKR